MFRSIKVFFSIFDEAELLDLFSQISQGHGESLEGPEEFFLYIEDLWDLGTPYKWQFVEALGYSQAQARRIPGLTNLRRVTKGWVAIRLVAKKSW